MSMVAPIQLQNLTKAYGSTQAVKDLNLSIRPNQITAFLGVNGAGKTTTIKMLLGMIRPSNGSAYLLGTSIRDAKESVRIRRDIAYVSESKQLYDYMTVGQILRFTRPFYSDWDRDLEKELLATFELPLDRRIKSLSKGMRTKTALLLAFARRPKLLILDEPSDGLDPIGIEQMLQKLVAQCSEGTTVFFSSHQIAEVERIADNVCMLHRGSLVLDLSMDEIRQSYRQIDVAFSHPIDQAAMLMPGVEDIQSNGRQMRITVRENAELLMGRAKDLGALSVECGPVGLREIFIEKAGDSK
ncbi:MAG TPA: ABC transporter ATP-binding protein [Edaphobacter sp.]|nr:ABC transporter ATP-binding protein [Edaphobacter sp.]